MNISSVSDSVGELQLGVSQYVEGLQQGSSFQSDNGLAGDATSFLKELYRDHNAKVDDISLNSFGLNSPEQFLFAQQQLLSLRLQLDFFTKVASSFTQGINRILSLQ